MIILLGLIKHTLTLILNPTYHLPLPIRQSVQKICDEVRKKQLDQEILCKQKRIRNPRLIDRNAFTLLTGKITHHAIDLVSRELDAAKSLAERILSIVKVMVWWSFWRKGRSDLYKLARDFEAKKMGYSVNSCLELLNDNLLGI